MRLSSLNPFRDLPNPREVWAWGMYDLSNQGFTLLVNTLFFQLYFIERIVVGDTAHGRWLWGVAAAISNLAVVIAGPALGAVADFTGKKKAALFVLWIVSVLSLAGLGMVGPGDVALAFGIYLFANFCFAAGDNFVGAFLPEIAPAKLLGRVSAIGWTMGYIGALLLLPISLALMGFSENPEDEAYQRIMFLAALWFFFGAIPTFLFLRERKAAEPLPPGQTIVGTGFQRFAQTAREARRFRQVLLFLAAFFLYSCGVQVVIYFAGIIAKEDFGFGGVKLVLFVLQLTVTAGIGAMLVGLFQDRLGKRRTVHAVLLVWIISTLGAAALPGGREWEWGFWVVGNGIGLGIGAIGTASRAFFGAITPLHKTAEFFGLWGSAYKLAAVAGLTSYGAVAKAAGSKPALLLVGAFFVTGFALLLFVSERAGRRDALLAQRAAGFRAADLRDFASRAALTKKDPTTPDEDAEV